MTIDVDVVEKNMEYKFNYVAYLNRDSSEHSFIHFDQLATV